MQLTIHGPDLRKIGWIDNDKSETLNFYDDLWIRDLYSGSSVFEFTAYKKALKTDTSKNKLYAALNERAFVSFEHKHKTYLFNVMEVTENEKTIKCYCENLNLELINEMAQPYESSRALTFKEYCDSMELLKYSLLKIGLNEIKNKRLILSFSQQETKLARLLNLVSQFEAEIEFETKLNPDSSLKSFTLNVYHGHDAKHHGVGNKRNDLVWKYGKNLQSVTRKVSKANLYTMIVPTARRSDSTKTKRTTVTNSDGTQTVTEKVTNGDKGYTVTTTVKDKAGKILSSRKIIAVKQSDGTFKKTTSDEKSGSTVTSTSSTSVVTHPDKSTTKTTTVRKSDGTTEKTIVHTKTEKFANKSNKTTVTTTRPDGGVTQKVTWKYANGTSNSKTTVIKQGTSKNSSTVSKVDESTDAEFDLSRLKDWKKTNANGELEFYKRGVAIYAPLAMQLYPSAFTSETMNDQWIRIDMEFDAESEEELNAKALEYLESVCYPKTTYEFQGQIDGDIGDSVWVEDDGFDILFQANARISRQEISFTNKSRNKTEVTDVNVIKSKLSERITGRMDDLVDSLRPYTLRLEATNGTSFKNSQGSSVIAPTLLKGAFEVTEPIIYQWTIGDVTTQAETYTVNASDVNGTAQLTIAAYVGNEEVASESLTFTNTNDGADGKSVRGLKILNKASATADTTKTGTFTENKPLPTKAKPYVISYIETELTDGTTVQSNAVVSDERNPELDALAESVQGAKNDAGQALSRALTLKDEAVAEANRLVNQQSTRIAQVVLNVDEANKKIEGKVSQADFNAVKGTVEEHGTTLTQQASQIALKAEKTYVDGVKRTSDSALAKANANENSISRTSAELTVAQAEIARKVSQIDFNAVSGRLTTAETTIREQAGEINKRLTSTQVNQLLDGKGYATSQMLTNKTKETSDSFERRIAETEAKIPTTIGASNLFLNSTFSDTKTGNRFTVDSQSFDKTSVPSWVPLVNTALANWQNIYHAYIGSEGGRDNVAIFNETNGGRNWKALQQVITSRMPQTTNDFVFSADVFATGPSTRLTGGIHYTNKAGNRAFHAGQMTLNVPTTGKWERLSAKVPFNKEDCDFSKDIRFYIYGYNFRSNSILAVDKVKLEEGTIPTSHTLAQEEYLNVTKFNEVKDTVDAHQRTIASLDADTVKKAEMTITPEGFLTAVGKTVNGETIASMIAQSAEWVKIIAKLLEVHGDMLVDGSITADKLNINTLSAIIADLGTINAGKIEFSERVNGGMIDSEVIDSKEVQNVRADGSISSTFSAPMEPYHAYDRKTVLQPGTFESYGYPLMSDASLANLGYDPKNWSNVKIENGRIYFTSKKGDEAEVTSYLRQTPDGGIAVVSNQAFRIKASNYTHWYQFPNGTKYKIIGDDVVVDFDLTASANGRLNICRLAHLAPPADKMIPVISWAGEVARAQITAAGEVFIVNTKAGQRYCTQIRYTL